MGQAAVQLCVDSLGGEEHQSAVSGFAFNQVAVRNLFDVCSDRLPEGGQRAFAFRLCLGTHQRLIGLKREFRVDDDRAGGIGQMDQAIRPTAVRKGRLPCVAVRGQRL